MHNGVVAEPTQIDEAAMSGMPAPAFVAADLKGQTLSNEDLDGRPAVLLFVSPDCQNCLVTLEELEALHSKVDGAVIVVCRSEAARCVQLAETYDLAVPVIADEDLSLSRVFGVSGAPTAVLLDADGLIESYGHPMKPEDLESKMNGWDGRRTEVEIPFYEVDDKPNGEVQLHGANERVK